MKSKFLKWVKKIRGQFPRDDNECEISHTVSFASVMNVKLGRWIFIGPKCFIDAKGTVSIEDGVILSSRVTILSSSHSYISEYLIPYGGDDIKKPVILKRGVWVGFGAIILPGVTIGEGAIVGAGAVVTKNIEPGAIVGGNPAKLIGRRESEKWFDLINDQKYYIKNKMGY